jgi:hypothetical protein
MSVCIGYVCIHTILCIVPGTNALSESAEHVFPLLVSQGPLALVFCLLSFVLFVFDSRKERVGM